MSTTGTFFTREVAAQLKTYVYRLIDPRNGETFYVGKGQGNRVFDHIHAQVADIDSNLKLKRIHEIHLAGFEVAHVIHRHGMDERTAFEVEAALMDAYPGLTNIAGGVGSLDFGAMHALEIIHRYAAEPAVFEHRALLINVNRSSADVSLYEATRYSWKVRPPKAKQAEVVLPTRQGLIVGAFVASEWLEATAENFPGREPAPGAVERLDLGSSVELTHLRHEATFTGGLKLSAGQGTVQTVFGDGAGSQRLPDMEPLSQIVDTLNERFGLELTETDQLLFDQYERDWLADKEVTDQARQNTIENFKLVFDRNFLKTVIRRMDENEAIFKKILDDEEFRQVLRDLYAQRVYRRARE